MDRFNERRPVSPAQMGSKLPQIGMKCTTCSTSATTIKTMGQSSGGAADDASVLISLQQSSVALDSWPTQFRGKSSYSKTFTKHAEIWSV